LLILGLNLDPNSSKSLDPDPHVMNADSKHCFAGTGCKETSSEFEKLFANQATYIVYTGSSNSALRGAGDIGFAGAAKQVMVPVR
jgi:hypothetical protein